MNESIVYEVVVYSSGTKEWRLNGKLHREDGPAYEHHSGSKTWYLYGNLHREDGPAVERYDGTKEWWLDGESLSEEEHRARTQNPTCNGKIVEIDGRKYKLTEV
jgi:hypothetical protein